LKNDRLYLQHVLECIRRVQRYTADGKERFVADTMIQDAVIRNLQTLSQSTTRISPELRSRRTDVPWRAITGFRNIVVHDYLGVDLNQVWDIVVSDLPALKVAAEAMLATLEPSDRPQDGSLPQGLF
jgi:uncharacterized protein with HEPN domain